MSDTGTEASAPAQPAPAPVAPPAVPQTPVTPNLVQFLLTPATAYGGIFDYATTTGRKLYANVTAKLEED